MNITPQTVIYLCAGVPFDNTYEHVRLLETTSDKINYFSQFVISHMSGCMYQRQTSVINYMADYDSIASANYLYFRNIDDGKYYFAFIRSIEFVNQNKSSITFEIDAFQTWFDKNSLRECFVEREHVNDDTFGKHLVPENLETGEYINNRDMFIPAIVTNLTPCIIMGVSEVLNGGALGEIIDSTYSGLAYFWCSIDRPADVTNLIKQYAENGKANAIVNMFMYPIELLGKDSAASGSGWLSNFPTKPVTDFFITNLFAPLDGYTPKNNKVYTSPYRYFVIYGPGSMEKAYFYEYFSEFENMFHIFSTFGGSAPIVAVPQNYKGYVSKSDEAIQIYPYPTCSWVNDNYANWLAQNQVSMNYQIISGGLSSILNIVGSGITAAAGVAAAPVTGGASLIATASGVSGIVGSTKSGVDNVANVLIKNYQAQMVPDSARGSTAVANSFYASGDHYLHATPMCIRYEYAKRIDEFFTHYGYKVSDFKIPNITGRKSWNFVKLVDCNINLTAPVEIVEKIKSVFLSGVTFWHTDDVKNYSLDNSIV